MALLSQQKELLCQKSSCTIATLVTYCKVLENNRCLRNEGLLQNLLAFLTELHHSGRAVCIAEPLHRPALLSQLKA